MKIRSLIVIGCLLFAGNAVAESYYVNDNLRITLRTGPSTGNKIIRMLPIGTQLESLESDKAAGYTRVRTENGREGWVLSRQISRQQPARQRLAQAETDITRLEQREQELSTALAALTEENNANRESKERLTEENKTLSEQLARIQETAANAIAIQEQNDVLQKQADDLTQKMEKVAQENRDLSAGTQRDWFLVGAGVIILGILIGLILPRLQIRSRNNSWDTL